MKGFSEGIDERQLMARTFLYLYGAGAVLIAITLLLPGDAMREVGPIAGVGIAAGSVSLLFAAIGGRLPPIAFHLAPALGSVLIALLAYFAGPTGLPGYLFFLIWVSLTASYFFGLREAVAHALFAGACVATVILLRDGNLPAFYIVMVGGTLMVNGVVMVALRAQYETVVDELDRAARTDALTGLANRREFQERFDYELARASRTGSKLGLIVFDIDHFKRLNDAHGHEAGDRVLASFGEMLRRQTREVDTPARIGGEEFVVLLPDTGVAGVGIVAERVRTGVEQSFDSYGGLTVSAGIAISPDSGVSDDCLLRAADRALYLAKDAGRNRTVTYRESVHGPLLSEPEPGLVEGQLLDGVLRDSAIGLDRSLGDQR